MENQSCSSGKKFQDTPHCSDFRKFKTTMEENRIQPEQFEDRIIFMSRCNHIDKSRKQRNLYFEFLKSCGVRQKISWRKLVGHSSEQYRKKNGTERVLTNQAVRGTMLLNWWWLISDKADTPLFWGKSALFRGALKSKGGENIDTLQHGSSDGRVVISHKISVHSSSNTGNSVAKVNDDSESKVAPTVVSIMTESPLINVPAQGN